MLAIVPLWDPAVTAEVTIELCTRAAGNRPPRLCFRPVVGALLQQLTGILRPVPRCRALLSGLIATCCLLAVAVSACGGSSASSSPADTAIEPLPTLNPQAKAIEPIAGESGDAAALPSAPDRNQPATQGVSAALPRLKKSSGATGDDAISNAEVLKNGIALPPLEAPTEVRLIIEAGNQIARAPYLWGGGHGKWLDTGYDCSGSISFALANAGLMTGPLNSGRLMSWGKSGKGKWVTIYTNPGHVFMVVAGVRFDTSGTKTTGSRWQSGLRPTGDYVVRHPPGL